uniref:P1 protein n=1 Tax=Rice drawf polerovirus TaxID=3229777 RepID=A0AAU8EH65_9VIRU
MEFRSYAIFLLAAFTLLPFSSQGRPEALGGADFFFDVGKPLIFLDGGWQQATLPAWSSISDPPSCTCAKCPELTESSYSELSQALFQKVSAQTHELFSEARGTSARAWNLICENLKTTFHLVLGTFLWLTAYSWAYILLAVLSTIWTLLAQHYVPVAFLVSLGIITVLICRAFKWIFGTGPTSLFIASLKYIFKTLTFRKYFDEKAIEGYKAYSIPQKPPKHSVVQIRRSDRSHIGYAVSVSLYNGKSALVTANHNMEEGCEFHSFRTGRAIKAADFRLLFLSKELDVILMEGPPNYESVLGCGSVHFTTSDILAKCPAALYAFEDGEWLHKSASVVGHHDHFATVLSQTQKGHSGGGYFHGKTLVGLHKGHPGAEYNYNLMITIPPIPGLTSPLYSVESDPPQGRVFSEGEVDKIEQIAEETAERLEKEAQRILEYKPVSGRLWADYEDELGNEMAAASASTTASALPVGTPSVPTAPEVGAASVAPSPPAATAPSLDIPVGSGLQDITNQVIQRLVSAVDISRVEKSVIDQIAQSALKKPRPQSRGKRGSGSKQKTGNSTSPPSTPGKRSSNRKPSQASKPSANSNPPNIFRVPKAAQNGGRGYVPNTLSWQPKQPASGGPKSGPTQN